jgi:hypothetical protein
MRFKPGEGSPQGQAPGISGEDRSVRIRADLERRGLAREASETFAALLASLPPDLSTVAYEATLDGVVLAWAAEQRKALQESAPRPRDLDELQRLLKGFGTELRKLEEALQILSTYVIRMRNRTHPPENYTLQ